MNKIPITVAGYKNMQDELKNLINKERPVSINGF